MVPVIFTIDGFAVSSLALFLYLSFFVALYIIWRLSQSYELDAEKTLDVFLITSFMGLVGARAYFVFFHSSLFPHLLNIIDIVHYPGYSFWGGLGAGVFTLWLQSRIFKFSFRFVSDFAIVGLLAGISLSSFGCFFSGCQYGQISSSSLAVNMVGLLGKRFPLQIIEGTLFFLLFYYIWKKMVMFHYNGVIAARGLILLGLGKLVLENFRGDQQYLPFLIVSLGTWFSLLLIIGGVVAFYMTSKHTFLKDLKAVISLFTSTKRRKLVLSNGRRSCYNLFVYIKVSIPRWRKNILKLLHVKANPTRF